MILLGRLLFQPISYIPPIILATTVPEGRNVHCSKKEICSPCLHDEVDVITEILTKLYNRFLWGRKIFLFLGSKAAFPLLDRRTVTQQQPTIPRCCQLRWPVAPGDVYSAATADEMPLNYNRKYVITEEFVNFLMLRGRNRHLSELLWQELGGTVSLSFAPCFKVLTHEDL